MNTLVILTGLIVAAMGGFGLFRPDSGRNRNFVSPEEWERDPEKAAEKQRYLVKRNGGLVIGVGLLFVVVGLFL